MQPYLPILSTHDVDVVLAHAVRLFPTARFYTQNASEAEDDAVVERLIELMSLTGFLAQFDWITEFSNGNDPRLTSLEVVRTADLELLRKIMTAHVRMDRFDQGHLASVISTGYWAACVDRLAQLRSTYVSP